MEEISICVYRDTIEKNYKWNWNVNLANVIVTKDFVSQYFDEYKRDDFDSLEEFLCEYTADDVQDFYEYAMEYDAVIDIENW